MNKLMEGLTETELRLLRLRVDATLLSKILSLSSKEQSELNKLENGIQFLNRQAKEGTFLVLFSHFNSTTEMAKFYQVSDAFVRSLRKKCVQGELEHAPIEGIDWAMANLERVGNLELLSVLSGAKVSDLRNKMKESGISNQDIVAGHKNYLQSSKGRHAELMYASMRGENITEDMNHTDPSARWDFNDKVFGKVNVKAAKKRLDSKGTESFTFSCHSAEHADYLCFMGFDSDAFDHLERVLMVPAHLMVGKTSVTLKGHHFMNGITYAKGVPELVAVPEGCECPTQN